MVSKTAGAALVIGGSALVGLAYLGISSLAPNASALVAAINSGKSVNVPGGVYKLPANFTGFKLTGSFQQVTCSADTLFIYPHGFPGAVLEFNDLNGGSDNNHWIGGQFQEDTLGLPYYQGITKIATGVRFYSHTSNGVLDNTVEGLFLPDFAVCIDNLIDTGVGFVNNNSVARCPLWHPQFYGVRGNLACAFNSYTDMVVEMIQPYAGPNAIAFLVDGTGNTYTNCAPEDATGNQSTCQVAATANRNVRSGGALLDFNYVNAAPAGANPGF